MLRLNFDLVANIRNERACQNHFCEILTQMQTHAKFKKIVFFMGVGGWVGASLVDSPMRKIKVPSWLPCPGGKTHRLPGRPRGTGGRGGGGGQGGSSPQSGQGETRGAKVQAKAAFRVRFHCSLKDYFHSKAFMGNTIFQYSNICRYDALGV